MTNELKTISNLTKAYYNGIREGIEQYAHWRDGQQFVGTCGTLLETALARIDLEEKHALKMIRDQHGVEE